MPPPAQDAADRSRSSPVPANIRRPIPPPPRRSLVTRVLALRADLAAPGARRVGGPVLRHGAPAARHGGAVPGEPAGQGHGRRRRRPVIAVRGTSGRTLRPARGVSPWLVKAVIATEDRRFYHHFGVDPVGLARASLDNLRAGRSSPGGSTITQQLAKNLYLNHERSLKRKLQELTLAVWLETQLAKEEILTIYLNRVYLGAGPTAWRPRPSATSPSPPATLSLPEAAMIAGLLKAPSALAPTNDLDRRASAPAWSSAGWSRASSPRPRPPPRMAKPARLAPRAADRRPLRRLGAERADRPLGQARARPVRPHHARPRSSRRPPRPRSRAPWTGQGERSRVEEAAVVLLDTTGAVRAMVGGRSHRASPFNRAVNAHRQPGSAFKPFVYLAALEAGWKPGNTVDDRPLRVGTWRPANFDGKFRGRITLEEAFAQSVNTAAVRLAQTVGPERVADGAAARRGLALATGALDRARDLGGHPGRADRRLPAVRHRRRPAPAVRRDQGRGRQRRGLLPPRTDGGAR